MPPSRNHVTRDNVAGLPEMIWHVSVTLTASLSMMWVSGSIRNSTVGGSILAIFMNHYVIWLFVFGPVVDRLTTNMPWQTYKQKKTFEFLLVSKHLYMIFHLFIGIFRSSGSIEFLFFFLSNSKLSWINFFLAKMRWIRNFRTKRDKERKREREIKEKRTFNKNVNIRERVCVCEWGNGTRFCAVKAN